MFYRCVHFECEHVFELVGEETDTNFPICPKCKQNNSKAIDKTGSFIKDKAIIAKKKSKITSTIRTSRR
jgi:predicted nucleic acid-binding Zn ribbon protein